jgi:formate transporter
MTETPTKVISANIIDALLPPEMAVACETAGVVKAGRDALALIVLGLLAGAFIAFGAIFMTVVLTGAGELPGALRACLPVWSFRLD